MRTLRSVLVGFGTLWSLSGQSPPPPPPAPTPPTSSLTVVNQMMTRSLPDASAGACAAPVPASSFRDTDTEAYVWFLVRGAAQGDVAKVEWYFPDGRLHSSATWDRVPSPGSWCFSARLRIAGAAPASSPGTWGARVYWNNAPLFTLSFDIVRPPFVFSVTNAASFETAWSFTSVPRGVAPGELVTLFGVSLGPRTLTTLALTPDGQVATNLAETRVLFDGVAAPLVYVLEGQISAIVPYAVTGRSSTRLQVEYRGVRSEAYTVPVVESAPGIFTLDSSGRGAGAILNQDGTINSPSQPAATGSIIVLYATGEGQTDPAGIDGKLAGEILPKPRLPVSVSIGGRNAEVLYAGAAPGLVAGVLQVNVRIPVGLPSGNLPVLLTIGSRMSQPDVTVAVAAPAVSIIALSISPSSVTGGNSATGRVTLSGPAPSGGATVSLQSNNAAARVPAVMTVSAGQTTATFSVSTTAVSSSQTATISASYGGRSFTVVLTVNPRSPLETKTRIIISGTFTPGGSASIPITISLDKIGNEYLVQLDGADASRGILIFILFSQVGFSSNTIVLNLGSLGTGLWTNVPEGFLADTIVSANLSLVFSAPEVRASVSGTLRFSTRNRTLEGPVRGEVVIIQ